MIGIDGLLEFSLPGQGIAQVVAVLLRRMFFIQFRCSIVVLVTVGRACLPLRV
ncbi:uncharacterized protein METZ01_LOCUS351096 [marine metagenome]|uniref:Uncharacterized protein n=1 Tax=marine metagenome TaxID=408172 RepID=A0A382RLV6_9ZZZZ